VKNKFDKLENSDILLFGIAAGKNGKDHVYT